MQKFRLSQFDFLLLRKTKMVPVFHAASFGLPHDTSMIRMRAACGSKPKKIFVPPTQPRVMATASSMPALKDNDTNLRSSLGTSVHSGGRLPVRVHPCMHSTSVLGVALTRLLGPLQVS